MKRKTIIYAVVDVKNKEFVVRNSNTDMFNVLGSELAKKVREMIDLYNNVDELYNVLAFYFDISSGIEILGVFDAENRYNLDQKTINKVKENQTNNYINNGWKENVMLDWHPHVNSEIKDSIDRHINNRNLITLQEEKLKDITSLIEEKENELDELDDYIIETKKENKKLKDEIIVNKQTLSKQNYIINKLEKKINELESHKQEMRKDMRIWRTLYINDINIHNGVINKPLLKRINNLINANDIYSDYKDIENFRIQIYNSLNL